MVDVTEKMIEAGLAAYGGFKGGIPRSHGELCRDIYTAMHSAREVDEETVERVARAIAAARSVRRYQITETPEAAWRNTTDYHRDEMLADAHAAIAAMGEGDVR